MLQTIPADEAIASARRTIVTEQEGLAALVDALAGELGARFTKAVNLLFRVQGRIVVTGMGKSGHIGRKVAATLASTGTPAFYVHPGEASHGDLGMITADDAVLALSWSGEAPELADIVYYCKRHGILLIAVTSGADSALGRQADPCLTLPKVPEAGSLGLAPTTSTTMQLALCDAIAVALIEMRGFTAGNFKVFHPGGRLGAQLLSARDIMHTGARLPLVPVGSTMRECIAEISKKSFGCAIVVRADGTLAGIVTDGDLRRHLTPNLPDLLVDDVMTTTPKTVPPTLLVADLLVLQENLKITSLIVAEDAHPIGLVHYLDLLRIGAA
ncbi:MAG: KpsF/GutQ family sugar-phosphate isomerase [Methylobacteriaceae bacterium]|jgi:arabinose-5-phosphate isomerase|nr:KpsF/GutQ family sugar-phosphate isomerase [Methylobacteriaceae bacterium]